ncbi:MAG TPA: glycerophosphodiester phosphodiesterase [Actinopolymorphaceae bacterium]
MPDLPSSAAPFEVAGHRGALAIYPGNSLAGFAYALEVGVHAVELDVWITADDELVLFHDGEVPTADGPTDIRTLKLREIPLSRREQAGLTDEERAPTLHELLALFRFAGAADVIIDVEVKASHDTDRGYLDEVTSRVSTVLLAHAGEQAIRVRSFDTRVLERFASLAPSLPRVGLIAYGWGEDLPAMIPGEVASAVTVASDLDLFALAPQSPWVTGGWVDAAHSAGQQVLAWGGPTLQDEADEMVAAGCDGLCVDDPAKLRRLLVERGTRVRRCIRWTCRCWREVGSVGFGPTVRDSLPRLGGFA